MKPSGIRDAAGEKESQTAESRAVVVPLKRNGDVSLLLAETFSDTRSQLRRWIADNLINQFSCDQGAIGQKRANIFNSQAKYMVHG